LGEPDDGEHDSARRHVAGHPPAIHSLGDSKTAPGKILQSNQSGVKIMLGKFIHSASSKADRVPTEQEEKLATRSALPKTSPIEEGNKLTVGPNIKLKGLEITDCEILVVEGRVEASMNSRDIRIAESGVFSGRAEIDVAEIRGKFEGELIVRKHLTVYSTGSVTGKIHYGALTIEEGGILSGEVGALSKTLQPPKAVELPAETAAPGLPLVEIAHAPHPYREPVLGRSPLGSRRI
jgi:cytoskeletal protein CcmA (bactofilin family)